MCCKLLEVEFINSPSGSWCKHCDVGKGCGIYKDRDEECKEFKCLWLMDEGIPEEFRPDKVKAIVSGNGGKNILVVHLDTTVMDIDKFGETKFGKTVREIAKDRALIIHEVGGRGRNFRVGKAA